MPFRRALFLLTFVLILFSCKKDQSAPMANPPTGQQDPPSKHILLKDIVIASLPSPYYHFEYNKDSLPVLVNFASGFSIYDVFYKENKIGEMRNNIIVNHDTLRYYYDPTGKLSGIDFINDSNIVYRRAHFIYEGNQIKEIDWVIKGEAAAFLTDRTVMFTFFADGNVKTMVDHRPDINGSPEETLVTQFENYDTKFNVDDFSLLHDTFHDHLFLLQGFRLQKNNPGKETFSVNGVPFYTDDYTYTYNMDGTPSARTGNFAYIGGPDSGVEAVTNTLDTYY
jgi:hypothetical protein